MNLRLVLAASLAASLIACGGGGDDSNNGAGAKAPSPAASAPGPAASAPPSVATPSNDVRILATNPSTPLVAGHGAAYVFEAVNVGPDAAEDVLIEVVTGTGQTLGSIQCVASGGAVCPSALTTSTTVPSLPADGRLKFTVETKLGQGTVGGVGVQLTATAANDAAKANSTATARASVVAPNSVTLRSDTSDYIGAGRSYAYSNTNAQLRLAPSGNRVELTVVGDENWQADFVMPGTTTQLQSGTYSAVTRYPFHSSSQGGMSWSGEGRGCNTLTGSFTFSNVVYVGTALQAVDIEFNQHCEGGIAALRGSVHWTAYDDVPVPGGVSPAPVTLWNPPVGATPLRGNYVYLASDSGDYIGAGRVSLDTQATTTLKVTGNGRTVTVQAAGWNATFAGMDSLAQLEPGHYGGLQRFPFHNPVKGGMSWSGNGRGCNTLTGWFVVDSISYVGTELSAIDLRFEQHCEGAAAALRGKIHWAPGDATVPAGPVNPPPATLWQPTPGATPLSGNYIYLASDTGDYIGAGVARLYGPATHTATVAAAGAGVEVRVDGWNGTFVPMNVVNRLEPGYYGNLERFPFHNEVRGGMDWSGQGRGCNELSGWFVVDSVVYDGTVLKSIDLRFEQHCEGMVPALRGKLHWVL